MKRAFIGLGLALALWPQIASAAEGMTISPALIQATINASQAKQDLDLTLTNHTSSPQSLKLSVVDFGSLDENGGLFLIGQPNDFERKYGLANWLKLGQDSILLAPGQTSKIQVAIVNQDSLTPGGHYGAILFKADTGERQSNVNLKPVLTELVFARKTGGGRYGLKLDSFDHPKGWTLPQQIKLRFQNDGNIHLTPRGTVSIVDPLGRVVKQGIINEDSSIILPETFRALKVNLSGRNVPWLPGTYRLRIAYRFDGKDNFATADYAFGFSNAGFLVAVTLAGLVGLAALIWLWRRKLPVPKK